MEFKVDVCVDNLPQGAIIMWYGNESNVPKNWAICNGATINGYTTPDLQGRFPIGVNVGEGIKPKSIGGNNYLIKKNLPRHDHTIEFKNNTSSKIKETQLMASVAYNRNIKTDDGKTNIYDRGGEEGNAIRLTQVIEGIQTNGGTNCNNTAYYPKYCAVHFIIKIA